MLMAAVMLCGTLTTHGTAIEHTGDRYIIHVDEMDLTGEESLGEVLAMCPEVIDFDALGANLAVRTSEFCLLVHNMYYAGDTEQYLAKTKAKEIDYVEVCYATGTMRGNEGLYGIIDVYYKKGSNGTSGRVSAKADSYGTLTTLNTVKVERDNLTVWGQLTGGLKNEKVNDVKTHRGDETAAVGMIWQINSKNRLTAQVQHSYSETKDISFDIRDRDHYADINLFYLATLSDRGATMEVQAFFAHQNNKILAESIGDTYKTKITMPAGVVEFCVPLYKDKLSVVAGAEGGVEVDDYDYETQGYVNQNWYYDFYGELDWNIHGVNLSIGDRVRTNRYCLHTEAEPSHENNTNHFFNFSVFGNISEHSLLKGTFAKSMLSPTYLDVSRKDEAYISELRYEYQQPHFRLTAFVNNSHTNYFYHANTFQVGTSAFWHKGVLRLSAALNYYNVLGSITEDMHCNVLQARLQPMLTLHDGWQIVPQLAYSSFIRLEGSSLPAHLNASLRVTKSIKNWDFDLIGNNLAHQRYGRRSVALGVTYNW